MKNFIHPQKISKFVLETRATPRRESKNRIGTNMVSLKSIAGYLNRKDLLSIQTRRRAYTQALIGITLSLSGCMGVYEGGFECPPGRGVGCKSISDVNQMVNHGELPPKSLPDLLHEHCERCGAKQSEQIEAEHSGKLEKPEIWFSPWALGEA
jgi:hypothetical protein